MFVTAPGQDIAELAWQALKIGYERLAGPLGNELLGGRGRARQVIELLNADRILGRPVLDIRQHSAGYASDAFRVWRRTVVAVNAAVAPAVAASSTYPHV